MGELERTMSWKERRDWQRFEAYHEPLPDVMFDLHFAMISSLMVNLVRSPEAQEIKPSRFFVIKANVQPDVITTSDIDRLRRERDGG